MKENNEFSPFYFNVIKQEIIKMGLLDQKMRNMAFEDEKYFDQELDRKNFTRLEEIVDELGTWLKISQIGAVACELAWLIVQHADHNINFQKHCLALMKELLAAEPDEMDKSRIAYLEDRIAIKETGHQIYGTQMSKQTDGTYKPLPIIDESSVNERRAEFNLIPLETQVEQYNSKLKPQ